MGHPVVSTQRYLVVGRVELLQGVALHHLQPLRVVEPELLRHQLLAPLGADLADQL